jgi:hypothetical protein
MVIHESHIVIEGTLLPGLPRIEVCLELGIHGGVGGEKNWRTNWGRVVLALIPDVKVAMEITTSIKDLWQYSVTG